MMNKAMTLWNSGQDIEVFKAKRLEGMYHILEKKYGCKSIPMQERRGYRPYPVTDPVRRRHFGLDGKGALLKEIIRKVNN